MYIESHTDTTRQVVSTAPSLVLNKSIVLILLLPPDTAITVILYPVVGERLVMLKLVREEVK